MQRIKISGRPVQGTSTTTSDASETLTELGYDITRTSARGADEQAQYVLISVEDADVRVSLGGTASTTEGHLIKNGDTIRLEAQEIPLAEFISAVAGAAATLQVTVEY